MQTPTEPSRSAHAREALRVALTVVGFLGVFMGPASVGALPGLVAPADARAGGLWVPFLLFGLGVSCLVFARRLRPPPVRSTLTVFGALVGWLAYCFGALLFGAGGGLLGLPLLVLGAWLVTRAQRAGEQLGLDESPEGKPWLVPALERLALRSMPLDALVRQIAERFDLNPAEQGEALAEIQRVVDDIQQLAPRMHEGLDARARALKLARRRHPYLDTGTAAALLDRATMLRER